MNNRTYPTSIQDLASYFVRVVAWLITHVTRLGITTANMDALKSIYGDDETEGTYLYCKKQYDDSPARKDSKITTNLQSVSAKMKEKLTEIYNDIPASKWTDEDRTTLNRKTGLKHTSTHPVAPINALCVVDLEMRPNGLIKIGIRERNDTKRYNIPDGADGVELVYAIVEGKFKAENEMIGKVKSKCTGPDDGTTRQLFFNAHFQFNVQTIFAGFNICFWVRWINSRHPELSGEWSGPHEQMII